MDSRGVLLAPTLNSSPVKLLISDTEIGSGEPIAAILFS